MDKFINKVIQGDCLIKLKELDDNSIDSIVTDPPYHLVSIVKRFGKENSAPAKFGTDGAFSRASKGFMGKNWDGVNEDGIGIAQKVELWKECLRVLKPGGYLLSFGGTRTYHRMACAIEDAGFEVRDMIEWVYGSGFPKSLNIGKAVDKLQGNEREVVGKMSDIHERYKSPRNPKGVEGYGSIIKSNEDPDLTKGTSEWEGWGTALKPSHEPICMARKPLAEKTVAENVLKWGTGGINIEQSRVPTPDDEARKQKILAGEVVCNAFCDKHGLYPSSLDDMLSFSQQQLLDFYQHIFSELGSYSISYTNLLHNLNGLDYKSCKQLLGVPYDCGRLSERVDEYVRGRQQAGGFQSDYPTLSRLYGECVRWNLDVAPDVFPLNNDVQSDILHYLSSKENNLLDNNPHLVFVLVLIAYSLLVNNNLHNHYTTCKNKIQAGRFPSNLLHDNSEEVRECFPDAGKGNGKGAYNYAGREYDNKDTSMFNGDKPQAPSNFNDSGNASRYFKSIIYQAKASKSERNKGCENIEEKQTTGGGGLTADLREDGSLETASAGGKYGSIKAKQSNNHPTVKPIALMEYLIKMVTPKGGIVLDPFMGSGTTGIACRKLNYGFIGIELEPDYITIAKARIDSIKAVQEKLL